jgi:cellobiose-specific phosphotransferase system component IIA
MFEDNEEEIKEMQAIILRTGGAKLSTLEAAKSQIDMELKEMKDQLQSAQTEISNFDILTYNL